MKKIFRKPLSVLLSILMAFSVMTVGLTVGASAEGESDLVLLSRCYTNPNSVWEDAANISGGLDWISNAHPNFAVAQPDGSAYLTSAVQIHNDNLFDDVTAATGLTFSFTYTPLQDDNHHHMFSFGLNGESDTANHLYISANPSWFSDGKFPVVGYVNGGEHINAYPLNGPTFTAGRTYDVVITLSNEDIEYYIDGVHYDATGDSDRATYLTQALNEINTYHMNYIGLSRWGDADLNAYVHDLRIYKGVAQNAYETKLSDAEAYFNGTLANDSTPLQVNSPYQAEIRINKDGSSEQIGTDFYSNIVYADLGETNFSAAGNKFYMENKIVTPSTRVVLVYDGVNETSAPIEFESKVQTNGAHSDVIHAVKSNSGVMVLQSNWIGHMSGGYQQWSGQHLDWDNGEEVRHVISYRNDGDVGIDPSECQDKWGNNYQQDNTSTSRFWYNKLYYSGTGDTEAYYTREQNISFQQYGSYKTTKRYYENESLYTTSDYYVINYKPVYTIKNVGATATVDGVTASYKAIDIYNEISQHAAYYTEESLAQAKVALYTVAKAAPSNFSYAGADISADTAALHGASFAGNASKVAAQMFGTINLVKKTATVRFENYDGTLLASDTYKYGETPAYSGTPSRTPDETKHYTFAGWDNTVTEVLGDATYTATFNGTAHSGGTATCLLQKECSVCHTRYGELGGHDYGTLNPQVDATCTGTGTKAYYECSVCHNYFDESYVQITDGLVIAANGHTMTAHPAQAATCTVKGNTAYWTCSECGLAFSDELGNTEVALADTVIDYDYNNHSTNETEVDQNTAVAAGCLTAGYSGDICCAACHHKRADGAQIDPQGHSMTEHPATFSTCSTHGNTAYWTCSRCNGVFSDSEGATAILLADTVREFDYTNHSTNETVFDAETAAAASCSAAGYTGDRLCKACGRRVAAGDPIAQLEHTYGEGEVVTAANCSEEGTMKYVCSECGHEKTETIPIVADAHSWVYHDDGDTHSKTCEYNSAHAVTGEAHHDQVIEEEYATTEHGGYTKYRCEYCGHEHTVPTEPLDRPFGPWVDDENGSTHTRTATDGSGIKEIKEHRWVADAEHSVPADCGHNAKTAQKCSDCGAIRLVEQPGTATGDHSWSLVGETAGTCANPSVKHYKCTVCNETKDENGAKDMNNHVGERVVRNAQAADCNNEGYTGDVYCSACDTLLENGTVSAKTGHNWEMTSHTSENPCVRAGTNTYTCSNCGEVRTLFEPAKGHVFGAWETVSEPTCTERGSEQRTCTACGETETRDINPLGHVDADRDGICDRCGIEWTDPDAPQYVFRCTHCDIYEANRDKPVIGIFYTLIHFFIHYAQLIGALARGY